MKMMDVSCKGLARLAFVENTASGAVLLAGLAAVAPTAEYTDDLVRIGAGRAPQSLL